jgi:LytS/YehU family sensor histidine kinase
MLGEQAKRQLTQLSFEHDFAKKVKDAEIAALKVKELETQKLWADLSSIHVGLSSNFLKNAFHTLSLEIKNNSQAALDLTDKLKDYYLGLLGRAKSKEPKLSDEIRSVGTYLQLHDLMRPGSIEYHPCIEETLQTDKMPFPAFVLQPIVENAIKHGIDKKDIPRGRIDLRITQNPGFVSVEIIDDGPGITASKKATAQHSYSTGAGINFIVEAVKRFNLQNKGITITFNPDLHISDVISNNRAEGCRVQIIISENFSNDKLHNN